MTELQFQALLAMAIPNVIQWLKGTSWFPFANFSGGSINRVFSWTIAAATGLGIAFKYDPAVGSVLITGLTIAGITHGLGHVVFQLLANHYVYKTIVAPPLPGLQQAINRDTGTLATASAPAAPPEPPKPPPTYVGAQIPGATDLFVSLAGDLTPIGTDVTVGGKVYTRISSAYYELKSKQ